MKKHELLKKAFEDYPEGTIFLQLKSKIEILSSGKFSVIMGNGCFGITDDINSNGVYSSVKKEWAKIVKPKIAVKVDNEKEFKALMKHYDYLGYVWNGGGQATIKKELPKYPNYIGFEDKFQHSIENTKEWETIHFSDFAKDKGIKLPLIKSEDGVWLYEGDSAIPVNAKSMELGNDRYRADENTSIGDTFKYFSTKQSALDWIEAQKPKNQRVCLGNGFYAIVFKDRFEFEGYIPNGLDKEQLHDITETMQELS